MFDRVVKTTGRKLYRVRGRSRPAARGAVRAETLDDLGDAEEPGHKHWVVTTCIAGVAGSFAIGAVLLGVVGQTAGPKGAFASVQPDQQRIAGMLKGDMNGSMIEQVALAPAKELSALYVPPPEATAALVIPERGLEGESAYPQISSLDLPYGDGKTVVIDAEIAAAEDMNITTISKTPPPEPVDETIVLAQGASLVGELVAKGVTREAAKALVAAIEPVFPGRMLKPGTRFEVTLDRQQDFYGRDVIFPVELSFAPGPKETVIVEADEDGRFAARIDGQKAGTPSRYAQVHHFRARSRVGSSLYATAKDHKVPDYITAELTRAFSYDVDFQRQVKASDTFEVFYGNPLTGTSTKRRVLHFAQLTLGGKTRKLYRFTTADGSTDYYDDNGNSATKALLRTPVSGYKLTSGFGMRRHPLLGYSRMHTGVDFGVPYGTPIRSAGAGKVEIAGRNGAYGIAVKVKHNGKYETLYAHMSRLAAGVRRGAKVNQGQIIGYVGSSGRSTGPHLHYEMRVNDRAVNPLRVKATGGRKLAGKDLKKFKQTKQRILAMMQSAPTATQVAQVGP